MQRIRTQIAGVTLTRDSSAHNPDGSQVVTRPLHSATASYHFEQVIAAEMGFTAELSYTRRKVVERCYRVLRGEIFVAVADLRVGSPHFGHWQSFYLREGDGRTLHVPFGVASGWQVLSSNASIEHCTSRNVAPNAWRWLRWNDTELAIAWPNIPETVGYHARRSRSIAQIAEKLLPIYRTSKRRTHSTANTSNNAVRPSIAKNSATPASRDARQPATQVIASGDSKMEKTEELPTSQTRVIHQERILVIGSDSALGRDLCRHLNPLGTVIGACRKPDRQNILPIPIHLDVSRPASIRETIHRVKPTVIVNAAELGSVETCESNPRLAQLVNATAPMTIADEALQIGAAVVHFCTDQVFDGSGEKPWRETDLPRPINQYGKTKLRGTESVMRSDVAALVLRSGWLYTPHQPCFVREIIDQLTYRNHIVVANNHVGTPTSTDWLAQLTFSLLRRASGNLVDWIREQNGLFHAAPLGYGTRVEVADHILATCRAHALPVVSGKLIPTPLQQLSQVARRPENCRLDCSKIAMRFQLQLPRWQQELTQQVAEILGTHSQVLSVA